MRRPQLQVLCVVPHPLARLVVERVLRNVRGIRLLPGAEPGALPTLERQPSTIILDAAIGEALGRVMRQLRASFPQSKFLLIGAAASDEELVRSLFMGIQGHLDYGHVPTRLVGTVRSMARGHICVPERTLQRYVELSSRAIASQPNFQEGVTDRQRAVLDLVMRDLSNKEIAAALHIAANTVKFHLSGIFRRLGVSDRRTLREVVNRQEEARASRLWLGLPGSRPPAGTLDLSAGLRTGAAGLAGARRDGDMS